MAQEHVIISRERFQRLLKQAHLGDSSLKEPPQEAGGEQTTKDPADQKNPDVPSNQDFAKTSGIQQDKSDLVKKSEKTAKPNRKPKRRRQKTRATKDRETPRIRITEEAARQALKSSDPSKIVPRRAQFVDVKKKKWLKF